jgi:hypothetical protein
MQEYLRETPSIIQDGAFYLALGNTKLNPIDLVDVAKVGFLLSATVDIKARGYT